MGKKIIFMVLALFIACNFSGCDYRKSYESEQDDVTDTYARELMEGYYRISSSFSDKYIDGRGFESDSAPVMQWSADENSFTQIWILTEVEEATFKIMNLSTGYYIGICYENESILQLKEDAGENSFWTIDHSYDGLYKIKSFHGEIFLDVANRKNDGRIVIASDYVDESQLWDFKPLGSEELSVINPEIVFGKMYFPGEKWLRVSPELQNMDSDVLDKIDAYINDEKQYEILSLLIARNGVIVYEKYWRNKNEFSRFPVYSISKSFTSALVGVAHTKGLIADLNAPVIKKHFKDLEIDNPDPRKEQITIHHMLLMKHGFKWNDNNDYFGSVSSAEKNSTQTILGYPMQTNPGNTWNYHTGLGVVLSDIVEIASGKKATDFYDEFLFEPIGIKTAFWQTDNCGVPLGGIGLSLTATDMLRFGHLYLNEGYWGNEEIISREYVQKSVSPITNSGWGPKYGYCWFVIEDPHIYYGLGSQGQVLAVIPSKQLVVGVTASTWTGNSFETIINGVIKNYIFASVE